MSPSTGSRGWLAPVPPAVAVEVASRRVTVAAVSGRRGRTVVTAHASESLPAGAVTPGLTGPNIVGPDEVRDALGRALTRAGLRGVRRAALVVPDAVARVSLVTLTDVPARPADLDALLRWHLRKSLPFPVDEARLSHTVAHRGPGGTTLATAVARPAVIAEYEAIADALDIHAGLVDLAAFNVTNLVLAAGAPPGDVLIVCLAPEGTSLVILRGEDVMFYRQRTAVADEPLSALVHQTAMYHADRLGGTRFQRIWLAGEAESALRASAVAQIEARLGVAVQPVDVREMAALGPAAPGPDEIDALAAPVGIIVRAQRAA